VIVWRVIGTVSLLIGGGVVYWAISSTLSEVDALTRGSIPVAQLNLRSGKQSVFLEGHLRHGIKVCHCPAALRARATIDGPEGPVAVTHTNAEIYGFNERDGVQIGAADIPRPGSYTVRTDATVGTDVAIGRYSSAGRLVAPMLIATALFGLSIVGFSVAYSARRAARATRPAE
jgi:hypothetical protein